MTTVPTMSSSNFTRNESTDRQKQIFKAVKQNNITTLNEFDNEHLKKTPVPSTSSCSQHESASDLNQNIMIIDRDNEKTQYAIVHVEDIEDNIQKAPNNQSDVMTIEKKNIYLDSKRTNHTDSLNSKSKKSKVDRSNVICEKELELANIKINHEIEICKLRKEREKFINELTIRKLLLEEKELKERVKLANFRAQKEM
ncbi:unnamed protein product [Lasius platythorax]|uniref:Uncharacterized protein n=1 Tax=Lasius platythorax TaxID=488582 RepID=A0AAV2P0L2_9HYME